MTSSDRRAVSNNPAASSGSALRRRAEASLRNTPAPSAEELAALAPEEMLRVLHDLRVYQVELEMQNEELRRAQLELDAARVRYFDLYDMAPAAYCTTSQDGEILQANFAAANLLGVARGALVGQAITRFIFKADQDIYYHLHRLLTESGGRQVCELRMVKSEGAPFRVHLVACVAHGTDDAPHLRIVLIDTPESGRA
jgi:PAS domain S-box-containing protein